MMKIATGFFLYLLAIALNAQVNNNIDDRIRLELDAPLFLSSTANATVQWKCINKKLTEKCLVYHNDQWFYFLASSPGRYYINVVNQKCKNLKGVQVLVIEGNPCETSTYRLVHCTSFTDQNDAFIELDSLNVGREYLINIDGFLADQCEFEIQFATKPVGFPGNVPNLDTLSLTSGVDGEKILLRWHATQLQLDQLLTFELFRINSLATRAIKIADVRPETNALGKHIEDYVYSDCISDAGIYVYKIIGVERNSERRILMDEIRVGYYPQPTEQGSTYVLSFLVNFLYAGNVELSVQDALTNKVLHGEVIKDGRSAIVPIDLTNYVAKGYRYFRIRASHLESKNVLSETFAISPEGQFIKVTK